MFSLQSFQAIFRKRLSAMISREGSPDSSLVSAFYLQQPSCQIPHLYFLLQKFLGERDDGYYVEVGAYDGVFASNTWGLAERGWQGILIEPIPYLANLCRKNYSQKKRIQIVQTAIGSVNGEVVLQLAGTLTTANADTWAEYSEIHWAKSHLTSEQCIVMCITLDEVLMERNVPRNFDLLVVDVEGFETEVFSGFDINKWKPKMLIVELLDTNPDLSSTEVKDARLHQWISEFGYVIIFKDSVNTIFVRKDAWEAAYDINF